jgi:hypothetical protein
LNWLLHIGIFLLLFWSQKGSLWFGNKVKDFMLMGAIILASGLINFIPTIYQRPLLISTYQKNIVTKKDHTNYVRNETGLGQRTIELNLEVNRRSGWNWLLNILLRNTKVYIKIESNPAGIFLQAVGEEYKPYEIRPLEDGSGFLIDITDFIKKINEHRVEGKLNKNIRYFIKETREVKKYYIDADQSFFINPALFLNSENLKAPIWLNWALGWKPKQHKIEYYQNGGS